MSSSRMSPHGKQTGHDQIKQRFNAKVFVNEHVESQLNDEVQYLDVRHALKI